MPRIAPKIYIFELSDSPDVDHYNVYHSKEPNGTPTYAWPFDGLSKEEAPNGIDLATRFEGYEGPITMAATTVDTGGNESDFGGVATAILDFQPPNPPGAGTIG